MRTTMPLLVAAALLASATAGCSRTTAVNPASPTSANSDGQVIAGQAAVATLASPVGLSGVVRNVDARTRSLTIETRSGSRLVRTDENTQVWSSGTRVRFTAIRQGMTVGVRGQDSGRFVLARTISIMR